MLRFLAKSALVTLIWTRYRRTIVSTLVLFAAYFLITMIHNDYVSYAVSADDHQYLWRSYLVKWAVLIGVTVVYYVYNTRVIAKKPVEDAAPPAGGKRVDSAAGEHAAPDHGESDPFREIRRKDKLKSRADIVLERRDPSGR